MRVCVTGCGYWGQKHLRVLLGLPQVDDVVLVDPRQEVREEMSRLYAGSSLATAARVEDVVHEVDAAVIATPPRSHFALSTTFLEAGKHVLVEKPMAVSSKEARRMMAVAAANNATLMVGHTFEYSPPVRKLRELVASGQLGRIYYIDTERLSLGLYQHDVNVVWDLAPHDVSITNYLLDALPTSVQAWGAAHAHARLEDVAQLRLIYGDQRVVAQIHVSWLSPRKVRQVTVVGSKEMVVYDDLASEERIRIYDRGVEDLPDVQTAGVPVHYRYGDITSPYVSAEEPLRAQDQHFLECLNDGSTPRSGGASGLAVVSVLEAAVQSLRTGSGSVSLTSPDVLVSSRAGSAL